MYKCLRKKRYHTFNWKVIFPVDSSLSTFLTNQPSCFKINKIEIKIEKIHRLTIGNYTCKSALTSADNRLSKIHGQLNS